MNCAMVFLKRERTGLKKEGKKAKIATPKLPNNEPSYPTSISQSAAQRIYEYNHLQTCSDNSYR